MLPAGFLVSRRTQVPARSWHAFAYGALTLSGGASQRLRLTCFVSFAAGPTTPPEGGLGSSAFARRYSRNLV